MVSFFCHMIGGELHLTKFANQSHNIQLVGGLASNVASVLYKHSHFYTNTKQYLSERRITKLEHTPYLVLTHLYFVNILVSASSSSVPGCSFASS